MSKFNLKERNSINSYFIYILTKLLIIYDCIVYDQIKYLNHLVFKQILLSNNLILNINYHKQIFKSKLEFMVIGYTSFF